VPSQPLIDASETARPRICCCSFLLQVCKGADPLQRPPVLLAAEGGMRDPLWPARQILISRVALRKTIDEAREEHSDP
jgi:hypothetical protein